MTSPHGGEWTPLIRTVLAEAFPVRYLLLLRDCRHPVNVVLEASTFLAIIGSWFNLNRLEHGMTFAFLLLILLELSE